MTANQKAEYKRLVQHGIKMGWIVPNPHPLSEAQIDALCKQSMQRRGVFKRSNKVYEPVSPTWNRDGDEA